MKELLISIIAHLIDYPLDVKVGEVQGTGVIHLELFLNTKDIGKVIGKNGKNLDAIRTILYAAAARRKQRITLDIIE